jgi:hypothetical protein
VLQPIVNQQVSQVLDALERRVEAAEARREGRRRNPSRVAGSLRAGAGGPDAEHHH